jgi:hypothetical protein
MTLDLSYVAKDKGISDDEVIMGFAALMQAMLARGIVRTKNITGDLGERYAESIYRQRTDLPTIRLTNTNASNVDAISEAGTRYSIKAASPDSTKTSAFHLTQDCSKDDRAFDMLIVVKVDHSLQPIGVYEFTWNQFWELKQWNVRQKAWFLPLSQKVLSTGKRVHP